MPGGKRNPLSMTNMLQTLEGVVQNAKTKTETHSGRFASLLSKVENKAAGHLAPGTKFVDLEIQFIGASGLPKMDVVGTADPYFIAKIDNRISFVSKVIKNNLAPVWNEPWKVKNVPTTATLHITVMDKDEGAMTDDYIGDFDTSIAPGAKEAEITGPMLRRERGTFWLKVDSTPSVDTEKALQFPYLFDGPIRYSRHFSPTVGLLTNLDDARLYSTWKMYIRGIPLFFRDTYQPWNRKYKAAQNIFQGPTSVAVRSGIQAGHRMLYARTAANGFGIIDKPTDVTDILHGGVGRPGSQNASIQMQHLKRVKPAVYTYIISSDDDSFRFSETGAAFFVDFASKHALHSNCNETVRYSGEFHPRPKGGWQTFSDDIQDNEVDWELVIDNNSGTYAPDPTMLPELRELLEYNFPGFIVHAWDREDPRLKESVEACRDYAVKFRGVGKDELQPTANAGEVTLMHQVSLNAGKNTDGDNSAQVQDGDVGGHRNTPSRRGSSGYGQPHDQDAYSSYYSSPATNINVGSPPRTTIPRDQPPPLPARPHGPPRTSSDYLGDTWDNGVETGGNHNGSPGPSTFPEPTRYVPPSAEGQYVPLNNPNYGYASTSSFTAPPLSSSPPLPPRPGSRRTSNDYATLPPGCAAPAKFDGQSGGSGGYGSGMMSRYDPSRGR